MLETGVSPSFELRMVKKDGTVFWALVIPSLSTGGDGEPLIQMVMNDISERKRMEAALGETAMENRNLMGELQHRVKNSFSMICSMINLASIESPVPETKKTLSQLDARVRSVSELYNLLYSSGSFTELRLDDYFARIVGPLVDLSGGVKLETEMEGFMVSAKKAAPIGLILTELVTNAVKYAFPQTKGTVTVLLTRIGTSATLEVRDDGVGLPAGFDIAANAGLGLNLVQGLTGQLKGVFSILGGSTGTCCRVSFPLG
jgi:two-component sensor histidine kinase